MISYVPENPRGMVYVFHGTNGSADFAERTESVAVLNLLIARGYGFVSTSSTERTGNKRWDVFNTSLQSESRPRPAGAPAGEPGGHHAAGGQHTHRGHRHVERGPLRDPVGPVLEDRRVSDEGHLGEPWERRAVRGGPGQAHRAHRLLHVDPRLHRAATTGDRRLQHRPRLGHPQRALHLAGAQAEQGAVPPHTGDRLRRGPGDLQRPGGHRGMERAGRPGGAEHSGGRRPGRPPRASRPPWRRRGTRS